MNNQIIIKHLQDKYAQLEQENKILREDNVKLKEHVEILTKMAH